ncbi:hypothetical protein ACIBO6_07480 [Streptomyces luteogriseus]|uniref:hypothetical protein n=1 Tax=Streptomyces luteogriseus TaxID=68233 RepID=UPI0037947A64
MNKIEQLTGRPLREHRTARALYPACPAYRLGGGPDRRPPAARLRVCVPPPARWTAARCGCRRGGTPWSSVAHGRSPGR